MFKKQRQYSENVLNIFARTKAVPTWTSEPEQIELMTLARGVKNGGLIVEIGALYGGMTAVLGMAQPNAHIITIDNFSWSPIEGKPASKKALLESVASCGVTNVVVIEGGSHIIGKTWNQPIDLLWIDGDHTYEFVDTDLDNFGPNARVIALHDWDSPIHPSGPRGCGGFCKASSKMED